MATIEPFEPENLGISSVRKRKTTYREATEKMNNIVKKLALATATAASTALTFIATTVVIETAAAAAIFTPAKIPGLEIVIGGDEATLRTADVPVVVGGVSNKVVRWVDEILWAAVREVGCRVVVWESEVVGKYLLVVNVGYGQTIKQIGKVFNYVIDIVKKLGELILVVVGLVAAWKNNRGLVEVIAVAIVLSGVVIGVLVVAFKRWRGY